MGEENPKSEYRNPKQIRMAERGEFGKRVPVATWRDSFDFSELSLYDSARFRPEHPAACAGST